jgi:hypothetical protein
MNKTNFKNFLSPLLVILVAILLRLLPHLPNFTPIAAMALFGGVYLNKKLAFIIPLAAMFMSDIFLGFHQTMPYVYGSFILAGVIGLWLKNHKSAKNVICASLISSILFFLITNFGVWAAGWYPKNLSGLFESYVMGIPFFKNTVFGDLVYTGLFFGGYELIQVLAKIICQSTQDSEIKGKLHCLAEKPFPREVSGLKHMEIWTN